jgi:hypothetical protein
MPLIDIKRAFEHCVGKDVHATSFQPGIAEVDERTAEVALAEGWATNAQEKHASLPLEEAGLPSPGSGKEKPSASQPAAPRSGKKTSKISKEKQG